MLPSGPSFSKTKIEDGERRKEGRTDGGEGKEEVLVKLLNESTHLWLQSRGSVSRLSDPFRFLSRLCLVGDRLRLLGVGPAAKIAINEPTIESN